MTLALVHDSPSAPPSAHQSLTRTHRGKLHSCLLYPSRSRRTYLPPVLSRLALPVSPITTPFSPLDSLPRHLPLTVHKTEPPIDLSPD